jgi:hypothetical protein
MRLRDSATRWATRLAAFLCVCATIGLTGCANYRAVSDFADDTTSMTGVVRKEFTELETLCVQQAQVVLVVNNIDDDQALAQCEAYKRTQGQFAAITVEVLDNYADALKALANDRSFDVKPSVKSVGTKLGGLKDRDGNAFIPANDVDAVTKIAGILVEIAATVKRDEAVQRMMQAAPDLATMGRSLKAFFVTSPGATTKAPYVNFVTVIDGSATSTQRILSSSPMRKAEPIRTAELLRDLRVRKAALKPRVDDVLPTKIGDAIDAWLAALDQFAKDGKKPDSQELIDRFKRLRDATRIAQDAATGS